MAGGKGRRVAKGARGASSRESTPAPRARTPRSGGSKRADATPPPWRTPLFAALALIAAALLAFALYSGAYLVSRHHGRGVAVRVMLPESPSSESVALALYRAGIINRPWLFSGWLTVTGTIEHVRPGMIPLRDDLTPRAVLRALASGGGLVRVTIPEGYNRFEIAERLASQHVVDSADEFLHETVDPVALARNGVVGDSLEGYLFPDTYDFGIGEGSSGAVDRMVRSFRRRFGELRDRHAEAFARAAQAGFSERDLVTLASLVEEETGSPDDRPRVAAVFWNRLRDPSFTPHLLQTDPSIVYGCRVTHPASCRDATGTARITITRAMLDDATNSYNTYRHEGLPPGPIASPGFAALESVLAPAPIHAFYFVAIGNGHSAFANTRAEHEANVQRYLRGHPSDAGAGAR